MLDYYSQINLRVFKYRTGSERDINSLINDKFWAPTREKLNDPYEGLLQRELFEQQMIQLERIFDLKDGSFDQVRESLEGVLGFTDKSGIFSLSITPYDELLWAHYADSHKGLCIEYDLNKLIEFTKTQNHIIPVKYSTSPPHILLADITDIASSNEVLLQKMLGTKSKRWEHEKEIRIVTSQSGSHSYDYRAVKSIYFGSRMDHIAQDKIMSQLAGRGVKYYKIKMNNEYSLVKEPVNDPYLNAPKYLYTISPILDLAITPEYVNPKYRSHIEYLYKAAEIIRRDPYCSAVEFVEFSPEKSTSENPIVLIMCPQCKNRYPKYYLTLKEIDEQYPNIADLQV